MTTPPVTFSDAAQTAAIRVAINAVDKDMSLGKAEREYHKRALESVADRIEDARRRRLELENKRKERG